MTPKLSLVTAILININIMIGAGIFVNTVLLAQAASFWGWLIYGLMGLLLLPLMLTFARLLYRYDGGTFYDFGAQIHPLVGFVSGFSYFVAKLASCALGIHVFVTMMQQRFPMLCMFSSVWLDCSLALLFVFLNLLNVRTNITIQYSFLALKLIPVLVVIFGGVLWGTIAPYTSEPLPVASIFTSIPFVLYAFTGFEACCSLSRTIYQAQKNGPRALIVSYSIGVIAALCYQLFFFALIGPKLAALAQYSQAFPLLLERVTSSGSVLYTILGFLIPVGIAASSLGAAYGIMYSNAWNIFGLAVLDAVPLSRPLRTLNRYQVAYGALVLEGIIVVLYLVLTGGYQVPLQQVCTAGMVITYTISTIALLKAPGLKKYEYILGFLGLLSCLLLGFGFVRNMIIYGGCAIFIFAGVLLIATVRAYYRFSGRKGHSSTTNSSTTTILCDSAGDSLC